MSENKINVGFRCDESDYTDVKEIARLEKRTISNVFLALVAAGVALYHKSGWAGLTAHERGSDE